MSDIEKKINDANARVMDIFENGKPVWVDVQPAGKVIKGMEKNFILVAGPPLALDKTVYPVKRAICGAAVHEGLAKNTDEAWNKVMSGEIIIKPAQDYNCSCGAAQAVSASMPVNVVKDEKFGGMGFCAPHPGNSQRVLRWGVYDDQVEKDLCWIRDVYGPVQSEILKKIGGIDVKSVLTKTAGMGDDNHCRQYGSTMNIELMMIDALVELDVPDKNVIIHSLIENERFFLHVLMAAASSIIASARNVEYSTVMVGMGGNGVDFGLKFSGTGDEWFTVPAPKLVGRFINPTYTQDDVLPYLGDSCVTEVYGFGGLAAIAGPSFVRLSGGDFAEAQRRTNDARTICLGEHRFVPTPWDDFRGSPVGVDMRKVVQLGVVPVSHGGGTHKEGTQGSAGACPFPIDCFKNGLMAFSKKYLGNN